MLMNLFYTNTQAECFYLVIASVSTVLFMLKLVFMAFFDFDSDVDVDAADDSFTFFSIQSILAFLMGFGWVGLAGLKEWTLSPTLTAAAAMAAGGGVMFLSVWLMFQVKKLDHTPKVDLNLAMGKSCSTYTRFAPNGSGQIRLELNGKVSIFNAINATAEPINSFETVKVVLVKDDTLYVGEENEGETIT
ncbi:MAG: hypothetical protein LBQ43_04680 [Holosporales bacterium]|jgi:hypothetical protein|nr:hypothetical protein [Holosporales bacterium]